MQRVFVVLLVALTAAVLAEGQSYYVPRAYYTIDSEGHASAPVPLRRLRRSINPYPPGYGPSGTTRAEAKANANAYGGGDAIANANARASSGGWGLPQFGGYVASNPNQSRH